MLKEFGYRFWLEVPLSVETSRGRMEATPTATMPINFNRAQQTYKSWTVVMFSTTLERKLSAYPNNTALYKADQVRFLVKELNFANADA